PASRINSPRYWNNASSGAPKALKKRTIMKKAMRDNSTVNAKERAAQDLSLVADTSLRVQSLRLCPRLQFRRDSADKERFETELEENRTNFANAQSRFIELEVNDVVICVHFITEAGDLDELSIQFQNLPISRKPRA